jgi:fibronectin type 3 domain-containing protein/type II secretory pathway pseudopilin PulG
MKKGFTLIEILAVLAGIAVIAGLLVTLIKPLELFKCARDSQRMNDLQALSSAIQHYIISTSDIDLDGPYQNRGLDEPSSTIFISVPSDKESLPTTFVVGTSTFIVNSVNSNNLKNIDGTGWLPINFQSLEVKAINVLPIDPINSYASKYFYSYVFHRGMRSFELNANLECNRYKKGGVEDKTSTDGGDDPDVYEVGSMLTLLPSEIYLSQRIKGLKPIIGLSDATTTITTVLNSVSSTKVYIYNLGSTTLAVYNITQQPAQARISTDKNYIIVPPWSFEPLTITCNAKDVYTTTTYTTTFKLWNNDFQNNPYNLNVICNVMTAPRITITPKELRITTKTGASSTGVIKISNKGSTNLNITNINLYREESTSTCDNFVSFNLSSSLIPSNQSATLTTIVDATTLNSKYSFYCKYYIESNDPYRPLQIVKVNIQVKSPPGEVFNVQVEKAGSQKLKISWSEPNDNGYDNIIGYRIYRKINATPTQSDFATSVPSKTFSFLDSGLANGTNYCYRVSAVNGIGEGPLSSQVACGIPMTTPSPPILSASPGNKKVDLNWSVSDNGGSIITGYDIYWKTANDTNWNVLFKDYQYTSTSHFVPSINNCINYQYYVIAKNSEGSSNPSNIASATPYGTSSPPKNASSTAGANYVDLTWQAPDDLGCPALSYYKIYKASSTPQNFVFIASTTNLSYRDSNVTSSVTYYYYITAVNSYGESDKSNIISATPGLSKCPAPTNLTLTPNDRRITLSWNTSLSSGYYYLYYSSNTPSNFVKFATVTHPSSTYTHTGLINGEVYYYYVTAENPGTCLESNPSNIASSSPGSVPSPPKNFKANSYQDRIELSWQPPESDGGFPILYYSLYRNYNLITTTSASTLSYIDRNIDPSSVYAYYVYATNKIGAGEKAYVYAGYCPSWSIIYGSENDDKPAYTFLLSNGKYIIVGETTLSSDKGGLGGKDGFLMRVDSLGNLELLNAYGGASDDSIRSFVELDDGNYLIAGITKSFGDPNGDIFLAKVSSSTGNVIWAKIYGTDGIDDYPFITRGYNSNDNYIYLTFSTQYQTFGGRDIVVIKLDQNGNIIWQKRFGGGGDDIPYKIVFKGRLFDYYNDYLFIVGYTQSYGAGNWDGLLIQLKTDGNLEYAKTYGGSAEDYLFDIMPTNYYGIYLFGRTRSFGAGNNDYMVLNVIESAVINGYTLGTSGQDYGFSYTQIYNRYRYEVNDFLLGRTDSLGAGSNDLLLIERDPFYGNLLKVITLGGSLEDELPVPPILQNPANELDQDKILITARTKSSNFGGYDIWLIKLDPDLNVKNSQNQVGFESGSGFKFFSHPTTTITVKNITTQVSVRDITNIISKTDFVSKNTNISLGTKSISFNKLYIAKCPDIFGTTTPSAPRNLKAENKTTYNQLTWDPPLSDGGSSILYYKIYRRIQNEQSSPIFLATTTNISFNDNNISQNKTYCYKVSAVNAVGEGPMSEEACAIPGSGGATVPGTPSLTVTPGNRQNTLNWTQPSDGGSSILEYRVYQYINGNYTLLTTTSPSTRTYTHQNLTNGQEYCYAVSARNSVGEGSKSNIVCGTPRGVPSPPQNLQANVGDRVISLSWSAPLDNGGSPITEYRIYRRLSGSSYNFNSPLATTSASVLSYNDTNVIPGNTYCYVVKAKNQYGESDQSNEVCNKAGSAPGQWEIRVEDYGSNWARLQFTCISFPESSYCTGGYPITKIKIYKGTSPSLLSLYSELRDPASANYRFTDTGLSSGVTYYYAIKVVNELNLEGPTSSVVSVTPGEREITGNIKVLWGFISRIAGENTVVVQDAFPAIGIQFDTPQYIDRLEMRTDPINSDYLKYLCDNYGGSDVNSWIKSPTTTLSIKRTCKTLIFCPGQSIISYYFIGKDANDIFNRQQITIYGTGFDGTFRWVSSSGFSFLDSISTWGGVIHTANIFDIKIYK